MKPVVDGLWREYEGKVDFMVYADLDRDATGSEYARRQGVSAVPTSMLVSADGREIQRWTGSISAEELREAFDAALAAGP